VLGQIKKHNRINRGGIMKQPKVIIVGGGFGGLNAAITLKKAPVEVLMIDKANHHLFQPLLYQVATAALSPGNIATPLREILAKQKNATVLLADISSINKENKEVVAANGDTFSYDYLILAPGARHSYFGRAEWETLAPGLKTLSDAVTIREKILLSYERAERCTDPAEAEKFMRFVVVGGGPTGVEMAGAIAEMAHHTLVGNFRNIKPETSKIYLVEGMDHVLPSFPKSLSEKALKDLEILGVDVLLNTLVTQITDEGVFMGDKFIETPNVIWAAGNEVSSLLKTLDVPLDKCHRVIVNPDLSIPGHPEIFVIGDAAFCCDKEGKPLPGIAPVAIQQGRYVAKLIKNLPEQNRKPFVYFNKGLMATIGKNKAIATVGKLKMSGHLAWMAWCFIHILYLITFSNRVLVMIQWFFLYISNQRRIRLITSSVEEKDSPIHAHEESFK
jgi:NADH:ubiquinone reductase (H+-translocating)